VVGLAGAGRAFLWIVDEPDGQAAQCIEHPRRREQQHIGCHATTLGEKDGDQNANRASRQAAEDAAPAARAPTQWFRDDPR
jgi:hypothetical protein